MTIDGSDRFVVLDSWRGLAALFVASFHFTTIWALDLGNLIGQGWVFVDFFFVLSGFVITHSCSSRLSTRADIADFMLRRIGRLWPLHILMLCLLAGLQMLKLALTPDGGSVDMGRAILGFVSAATFLHSTPVWPFISLNGPSWSISAEFWTYLIFAVVIVIAGRQRFPITVFAVWIAAFLVLILGPGRLETYAEFAVIRCLYGFLAGVMVHRLWTRWRDLAILSRMSASIAELMAVALTVAFVAGYANTPLQFLAPIVFGVTILIFANEGGIVSILLRSAPFVVIGDLSYSIYLTHSFLREVIRTGMQAAGQQSTSTPDSGLQWLLFVAFILAILCLSAVTRHWIEKPGQRLFTAIAHRVRRRNLVPDLAR